MSLPVLDGKLCGSCFTADMVSPLNGHPAYVECPNCGAIELTYIPQDYQAESHQIPYVIKENGEIRTQIIGYFGG